MSRLKILESFVPMAIQDLGRPGLQHWAIVQGGAADREGFLEGAAILDQPIEHAAIEWLGIGGRFGLEGDAVRAVLTGAEFAADLDGAPIEPALSFRFEAGQVLTVQGSRQGNFGYLHVGGGFDVPSVLGSRATHLRAGFGGYDGRALRTGDGLPIGVDGQDEVGQTLSQRRDLSVRQNIRVVWGVQAHRFSEAERARFLQTRFTVSTRLDRMGVQLDTDAEPIQAEQGLHGLSDAVVKGDLQIAGEGRPTVLLADHQPTGGYPRLATVITADHDPMAQLPPGTEVRFALVGHDKAVQALRDHANRLDALPSLRTPRIRDPKDMPDLLSYELTTAVVEPEPYNNDA